jgi:hypothetical protein
MTHSAGRTSGEGGAKGCTDAGAGSLDECVLSCLSVRLLYNMKLSQCDALLQDILGRYEAQREDLAEDGGWRPAGDGQDTIRHARDAQAHEGYEFLIRVVLHTEK